MPHSTDILPVKVERFANWLFMKCVNWGALVLVLVTVFAMIYSWRMETRAPLARDLASMPIPGPAGEVHGK